MSGQELETRNLANPSAVVGDASNLISAALADIDSGASAGHRLYTMVLNPPTVLQIHLSLRTTSRPMMALRTASLRRV